MNIKIVIVFLIFTGGIFSQQLLPIQHDTSRCNQEIILSGTGEFGSTSLRNEFTSKLIFGGEITEPIKQSTFRKHTAINRVGIDLNSELEYRNYNSSMFKKENLGFLVRGGYYAIGSGAYSREAFGLTFNGNSDYLGETINLAGTSFSFLVFQKIGFGVINKVTKSNVSLNLFNISDVYTGRIQKGLVVQNSEGTFLDADLKGNFTHSTSSSYSKGIGVGIDIDYRILLDVDSKKSTFQVLTKNLGVAHYSQGIETYSVDSSYYYMGFKLNQIYGDNSIFSDSLSLLEALNINRKSEKKTIFLPGYIQIGKIVTENYVRKVQSFYGFRMYPSLAFVPQVYIGAHFSVKKWMSVGFQGSYGGFSNLRVGCYFSLSYRKYSVGLASQDIYGAFSKKGYGQSILVRLRWKI